MTEIIPSLAAIAPRYDALLCDLWGCLHDGKRPFPAAVAALQGFRRTGGKVMLVTNAPRPASSVIAQLDSLGVPRDAWDAVVSSGDAAQYALLSGAVGRKVYPIGAPKDEPFYTDFAEDLAELAASQPKVQRVSKLQDAEGIVCTGLRDDLTETPADYRGELLLGKTLGLPFLCANPDIVVHFGDKLLYCAGALARDYEEMGGSALYFGKPHPPIYDLARRRLARLGLKDDAQLLAVGDGIATDIQGAMGEGIDSLYVSGGIDAESFGPDSDNPDKALLEAWLNEKMMSPTFTIGHLR
jgi:HAD superfamily hydrolase (TIGR01459 family)